jgi:hypothetical protein
VAGDDRNDLDGIQRNPERKLVTRRNVHEAGLRAGVTHIFVEQEPPFKEVPAMEAAEIDYRALKSLLS